jgi:hypothetical protein
MLSDPASRRQPYRRRRLRKSSDLYDLCSELSVMPGSKLQFIRRKLQKPNNLLAMGWEPEVLSLCSNPPTMGHAPCQRGQTARTMTTVLSTA